MMDFTLGWVLINDQAMKRRRVGGVPIDIYGDDARSGASHRRFPLFGRVGTWRASRRPDVR